jgi:excinuclease UvrABC nuclease subunit
MVSKADNIDYFLAKNEEEALLLEEKLVKLYNPPYNSLLK